jgi:hypothetical protein
MFATADLQTIFYAWCVSKFIISVPLPTDMTIKTIFSHHRHVTLYSTTIYILSGSITTHRFSVSRSAAAPLWPQNFTPVVLLFWNFLYDFEVAPMSLRPYQVSWKRRQTFKLRQTQRGDWHHIPILVALAYWRKAPISFAMPVRLHVSTRLSMDRFS